MSLRAPDLGHPASPVIQATASNLTALSNALGSITPTGGHYPDLNHMACAIHNLRESEVETMRVFCDIAKPLLGNVPVHYEESPYQSEKAGIPAVEDSLSRLSLNLSLLCPRGHRYPDINHLSKAVEYISQIDRKRLMVFCDLAKPLLERAQPAF